MNLTLWENNLMGVAMFNITAHMRKLRERAGFSMDELAKAMGYARASSIQRYENADDFSKDYFSIDFTQKLAKALIGQGVPAITFDEVWALALPDARQQFLQNFHKDNNGDIIKQQGKMPHSYRQQAPITETNEKDIQTLSYGMAEQRNADIFPNASFLVHENQFLTQMEPNAQISGKVNFPKNRLLPVYGQAVAGINGEFEFNGNVVFEVLCPPQLSDVTGAYAVQISGESMWPRYRDGELVYCDPTRRVKKGDFVVAQIMMDEYASAPQAFVKMFVRHNFEELVLEQFNPASLLTFPHQRVVSVHYIALSGDAL